MHTVPANPLSAVEADARHTARVRRILMTTSAALIFAGLLWGVVFALRGDLWVLALDILMVATGLTCIHLTRGNRLLAASVLEIGVLFFVLCSLGFVQDVPTAAAPRSMHFFFLPVGVAALVLFRTATPLLKHGFPIGALVAFVVLGSTNWGLDTPYALPDAVRVPGTWANAMIAMALLYALVRIMQTDLREDHGLVPDLRAALAEQQFELHYQPQVRADGTVICAEALIRWNHPTQGRVSPGLFIPVAEQSGLILPLGNWVLREACAQLVRWADVPHTGGLSVSVNVSAVQFRQADFLDQVRDALGRSGAPAQLLKIELTESMLAEDLPSLIEKMQQLRGMGVRISLDDFGTGFSSLNYLKNLPLDQLKLDQSFVSDVLEDPNDAAIVRTVIDLGLSLGLEVIAEGVETAEQRDYLAELGCPAFQGYLFSRPLPVPEFERYMERQAHPSRFPEFAGDPLMA